MSVRVKDTDHGYKKRVVIIKEAAKGKGDLTIGIHAAEGGGMDGKTTVLEVAIWNEFGTSRIPSRSFLRAWFDENGKEAHERLFEEMKKVAEGKQTKEQALERVGLWVVGQIQARISAGVPPPNADSTIAQKGSSKPLINTGTLRSSITSKVN